MVKIFGNTYNEYEKVSLPLRYYAVNGYNIFSIANDKSDQEQLIWFLVEFQNILRCFLSFQPFSMEFSKLSNELLKIYIGLYKKQSQLPDDIKKEVKNLFNSLIITKRIIDNNEHFLSIDAYLGNVFISEIKSLRKMYNLSLAFEDVQIELSNILKRRGLDKEKKLNSFFKSGKFLYLPYDKIEELCENRETNKYILDNFSDLFIKYMVKKFVIDGVEPEWNILSGDLLKKLSSEIESLSTDNSLFKLLKSLETFDLNEIKRFLNFVRYNEYPSYPMYDISLVKSNAIDNLDKIMDEIVFRVEEEYKNKKTNSDFELWDIDEFKVMIFLSGIRFHYRFQKMVS